MKITLNPTFSIESGELLSHDGIFEVERIPILFDRSAQKQAGQNVSTDKSLAGGFGTTASGIGSTLIPGLEREANNPTGFTPMQKNDQLVAGAEAAGGVNSGLKGTASLETARTKTAGGFAPALDEAARIKSRQLSSNALNVSGEDARLAQEKQRFAQGELGNLYGGLNEDQLKAMGLSDEAINTQLRAGQTGWQQNAMGWLNALKPSGGGGSSGAAAAG